MNHIPLPSILGTFYFFSELVLGRVKRAQHGASEPADRGSTWVLWIVIGFSIGIAYQVAYTVALWRWPPSDAVTAVGIVLMVAGLALRWYSIIYLGRFFTVNVTIAADHQLIDTGPYRRLRHPSYSGGLLAFLGLGICMQHTLALLILMVGCTGAFLYRMRVEERALTEAFGDCYRAYMQRTARLIPGAY